MPRAQMLDVDKPEEPEEPKEVNWTQVKEKAVARNTPTPSIKDMDLNVDNAFNLLNEARPVIPNCLRLAVVATGEEREPICKDMAAPEPNSTPKASS